MEFISLGDMFLIALVGSLLSGLLATLIGRSTRANTIVQVGMGVSALFGLVGSSLFLMAASQGALKSAVLPDLGFIATPLSAFFLLMVYVGVILTSVYAIGYLPKYKDAYSLPMLNFVSALFIVGMQIVLLSPSVFWFLVGWEVMSAAAYFLVISDRSDASLYAGFLYFVMTQLGFACILAGFLIMTHGNPFLDWSALSTGALFLSPEARAISFLLLFAGFGSKAGLVPLHNWLPYAHPQAPSHSSALLSGVMLKVALYGFILTVSLLQGMALWASMLVLCVGLVSALFGALFAVVEIDAKRMLAWSSVENMGLIFAGIGSFLVLRALPDSSLVHALTSASILFIALHTLNHFLFKSGLFMAAGAAISETHTRDIDQLGGLAQKWPLFSGVFLALTLAAAALPPFGTFFGEWVLVQGLAAAVASLPTIWAIASAIVLGIIALVSGLAIFAFVKLFSAVFLGRARSNHAEHVGTISAWLYVPPMVCALLSVCVGLFGPSALINAFTETDTLDALSNIVIVPQGGINPWMVAMLVVCVVFVALILQGIFGRNRVRVTETWDCGQPLTARMEYTATGFASPIRFFFRGILLSRKELYLEPISSENPWITKKRMEWGVASIWERALYQPITSSVLFTAEWVKKLQNGSIQLYLVFVLIALIASFIVAL